jgi:hypothetical protein
MIYVLWVAERCCQGTTTQPRLLYQGDLKKIVKLGSNLRLTFWAIAALSIPRGRWFIAIAAQVHTYYMASVWRDPDVPIEACADACAVVRDHDRLPL